MSNSSGEIHYRVIKLNDKALTKKLDNLLDSQTMLEIHNLYAKMMDPYVPFLEGPLSQTVEVTPAYVKYIQPYARYQYHGVNFNHTKDYHPLASAEWDKAMMRDKGEEFKAQVTEILRRRAKVLYG